MIGDRDDLNRPLGTGDRSRESTAKNKFGWGAGFLVVVVIIVALVLLNLSNRTTTASYDQGTIAADSPTQTTTALRNSDDRRPLYLA